MSNEGYHAMPHCQNNLMHVLPCHALHYTVLQTSDPGVTAGVNIDLPPVGPLAPYMYGNGVLFTVKSITNTGGRFIYGVSTMDCSSAVQQ
jgi:hypothetical protein